MLKTYSPHILTLPLSKDSKGNIVVDNAGNAVLAIPNLTIRFISTNAYASEPDVDETQPIYRTAALECNGTTYSFDLDSDAVVKTAIGTFYGNSVARAKFILNLAALKKISDTVTIKASCGTVFDEKYVEEKDSEGNSIYCIYPRSRSALIGVEGWDERLSSLLYNCGRPHIDEEITINFDEMSVSIIGQNNSWQSCDKYCRSEEPPVPPTPPVYADYKWCYIAANGNSTSYYVYTVNADPIPDVDNIWAQKENPEGTSPITEVSSVDSRNYIIVANLDDFYWRDTNKDKFLGYDEITVHGCKIYGSADPATAGNCPFFIEERGLSSTKRIFNSAFTGSNPTNADKEAYTTDKHLVSQGETKLTSYGKDGDSINDFGFTGDTTGAVPLTLINWMDDDGNELLPYTPYGYLKKTGNTVTLKDPNYPDEDFYDEFTEVTTYNGRYTFWLAPRAGRTQPGFSSRPYWEYDADSGFWQLKPDQYTSLGYHKINIRSALDSEPFLLNGTLYCHVTTNYGYDHEGRLYDPIWHYAWSTTPCSPVVTLYTSLKSPSVSEECFGEAGERISTVESVSSGTYSITGKNGQTYYSTAQPTDQDFE